MTRCSDIVVHGLQREVLSQKSTMRLYQLLTLATMVASCRAACHVNMVTALQWSVQDSTAVAVELNFTAEPPVPTPWTFSLDGPITKVDSWHWSVDSENGFQGTVSGYWQGLNQTDAVALGSVLYVPTNTSLTDITIYVNEVDECSVNVTQLPAGSAGAAIESAGAPQRMSSQAGQLLGVDGMALKLLGVNLFGFDSSYPMLDGLWGGSDSQAKDFATVVYRMQLLGMNAVRIPFSFLTLYSDQPPPTLAGSCPTATMEQLIGGVTPPNAAPGGFTPQTTPANPSPPGSCNYYLPNTAVFDRFVFVVRFFAQNGFYVLLDDQSQGDPTVLNDIPTWIGYWTELMKEFAADPATNPYIMVDPFNEPDYFNMKWETVGGVAGAADRYIAVYDSIHSVNPDCMLVFEGLGQGGYVSNWATA